MAIPPDNYISSDTLVKRRGKLISGYYIFNGNDSHPYSGPHWILSAWLKKFIMDELCPGTKFRVGWWIP